MAMMSLRGYARHRGCALSAVQKAIKTGRITVEPDGKIDSSQADIQWARNTERHAPPVAQRGQEDDDGSSFGGSQYTKARAVREHYQARLTKIEYEERVAKLVPKDEVQVAAFNKFRQFRDHMLNIPDRIAAMVAAETEAARCYEIIAIEIRKALNDFSDSNANG
jgi:pyruvate/2-oxoglutarate dehydrogenase complex dihydrolipoamide acyltransferase (E2) component